ncbi:hypothetical protein ABIB48_003455 [Arthrobacter sp. UYCu511]|uniref:hypothetical protein n=1 Tax=Arthrobacter sp. UYCu511 TaxID=3156337 RepID=UPI00339286CB
MNSMLRKFVSLVLVGLLTWTLGSCGAGNPQKAGESFGVAATAALDAVSGVEKNSIRYTDPGGLGATVTARVTASPSADLETVMGDSLRAFAESAGSIKPLVPVYFYVFPKGAEENGIRPDALGLAQSPTMDEIREFTNR